MDISAGGVGVFEFGRGVGRKMFILGRGCFGDIELVYWRQNVLREKFDVLEKISRNFRNYYF